MLRMKNAFLSSIMLVAAVCAAALAQTKSAPAPVTKGAPKAGAPKAATKAKAGPNLLDPSTLNAKAPPVYLVKLNTTKGPIVIRVTKNWAPVGADRFYNLVRAGFYNNNIIFRSTKQFAQFGIPSRSRNYRGCGWNTPCSMIGRFSPTSAPWSRSHPRATRTAAACRFSSTRWTTPTWTAWDFPAFGEVIEGLDVLDMLYSGYGETVTNLQGEIMNQGNALPGKELSTARQDHHGGDRAASGRAPERRNQEGRR